MNQMSQSFLEPSNFNEAERFANLISQSDFAPKDYKGKPGNVLVAMQFGYEIGLKPMQALQNISVINGRPAVWGDAALGIVRAHPSCKMVKEWMEGSIKDNTAVAYCEITRGSEKVTRSFSIDQARRAGLIGKAGVWQVYPERMLQMRARGFAVRDAYPDLLKGMYLQEELESNGFNKQEANEPSMKIGNDAIQRELIESENNNSDSKLLADQLSEEISKTSDQDQLNLIGIKIKDSELTISDKKRLSEIYRNKLIEFKSREASNEKIE